MSVPACRLTVEAGPFGGRTYTLTADYQGKRYYSRYPVPLQDLEEGFTPADEERVLWALMHSLRRLGVPLPDTAHTQTLLSREVVR